jgi:Ig-like domain from next to BRCA1 gene/Glycosyl hydrolase family 46
MSTNAHLDQAETAGFIPPDAGLDNMTPGEAFRATWVFKNRGNTTWNSAYKFVFIDTPHPKAEGYPMSIMSANAAFTFSALGVTADVPPGGIVHLTLPLTAPTAPATYATIWQLRTAEGRPFGPVLWLRATVIDKIEQEETNSWRATIWGITSVFESGVPSGRADAFQNADAGIVSYGKHQATLQSGNLEGVLNAYFQRSSSPTSQALQQEFAARVQRKEESLRHDGRFKQLLLEASQEAAMGEAQDELFATNFYLPVVARAKELGIKTALGVASLYDTRIQGGLEGLVTAVSQKLGVTKVGETGSAGPVDEPTWLRTFLDEREAWLNRLADKKEAQNKLTDAQWLRTSTFRVVELRRLLNDGNLTLADDFSVRGQRIRGRGRAKTKTCKN